MDMNLNLGLSLIRIEIHHRTPQTTRKFGKLRENDGRFMVELLLLLKLGT